MFENMRDPLTMRGINSQVEKKRRGAAFNDPCNPFTEILMTMTGDDVQMRERKEEKKKRIHLLQREDMRLSQLLGFMIESVHNFAHMMYGIKGSLVCLVLRCIVKQDEHTLPLIQDSLQFLVKYHLGQLLLHLTLR